MISVIEPSCGALLVASIRFPELAAAGQITTGAAAVALPPIAMAADIENPAAFRGMASSATEDKFQGTRPFRKVGLDNGPHAVAGFSCVLTMGALPSSRKLTPIVRAVGVVFFITCSPPRYHELHLHKIRPRKRPDTQRLLNREQKID